MTLCVELGTDLPADHQGNKQAPPFPSQAGTPATTSHPLARSPTRPEAIAASTRSLPRTKYITDRKSVRHPARFAA